jgi:hypothetical protein
VHPHRQTDDAVGQVVGVGGAHALPWGMPPLAGSRGAVYGGLIPVCGRVVVSKQVIKRTQSFTKCTQSSTEKIFGRFAQVADACAETPCAKRHILPL